MKEQDYSRAHTLLIKYHDESTQLATNDKSADVDMDAVYNPDAENVTCPACSAVFSPREKCCPECGLQFA